MYLVGSQRFFLY